MIKDIITAIVLIIWIVTMVSIIIHYTYDAIKYRKQRRELHNLIRFNQLMNKFGTDNKSEE